MLNAFCWCLTKTVIRPKTGEFVFFRIYILKKVYVCLIHNIMTCDSENITRSETKIIILYSRSQRYLILFFVATYFIIFWCFCSKLLHTHTHTHNEFKIVPFVAYCLFSSAYAYIPSMLYKKNTHFFAYMLFSHSAFTFATTEAYKQSSSTSTQVNAVHKANTYPQTYWI